MRILSCAGNEDIWGREIISPLILVHVTKRGEWLALRSGRFIPVDSLECPCVGPRTVTDLLEKRNIFCLSRKRKHDCSDIQPLDLATATELRQRQLEVASRIRQFFTKLSMTFSKVLR
jgi:hypothetical protein